MKIKQLEKKLLKVALTEKQQTQIKGGHNWLNSPSRTGDGTRNN